MLHSASQCRSDDVIAVAANAIEYLRGLAPARFLAIVPAGSTAHARSLWRKRHTGPRSAN
jgi:hypothetical protein